MSERERLTDAAQRPTAEAVADFIGGENSLRWSRLLGFIDATYPGVFVGEWLYAGSRHGWSLRFKKSRSFCTLIPERDRMNVLIVFGAAERAKAETILADLTPNVRQDYLDATTHHDGKWLLVDVDSDEVLSDIERLLAIKRKPPAKPCL